VIHLLISLGRHKAIRIYISLITLVEGAETGPYLLSILAREDHSHPWSDCHRSLNHSRALCDHSKAVQTTCTNDGHSNPRCLTVS
jgi:hypothetical protein